MSGSNSAKQNYASLDDAIWFEAALYTLDNGEVVSATVPWQPPDFWSAITTSLANRILDEIDAGLDNGTRWYSAAPAAKDRAAWPVVIRHIGSLTEAQARKVIKTWHRNGVLVERAYDDPVDRRERSGLFVNHAKSSRRKCALNWCAIINQWRKLMAQIKCASLPRRLGKFHQWHRLRL